jgi:hypothetical protein
VAESHAGKILAAADKIDFEVDDGDGLAVDERS